MIKKSLLFVLLIIGAPYILNAQQDGQDKGMEDMFVHPFLAHMALADKPGEVSLRLTPFQQRTGSDATRDLAAHIEAGLMPRLGLHIRTDGIGTSPRSEVMLMYNVITDKKMDNGVSLFGQVSIPTGPWDAAGYRALFGAAGRVTIPKIMVMDANMHVNLKDNMAEYESAFVFKASQLIYPIFEIRGEIMKNTVTSYSLLGLKFRVKDNIAFGAGFQLPLTTDHEYNAQALLTLGMAF
jgi:hypothetical protein